MAQTDQSISDIDAALAASKARREAKAGKTPDASASSASTAVDQSKRHVKTPEQRAADLAAQERDRKERKDKRDAERAERKQAAEAKRAPAHMKKVEKAAAKLGDLDGPALLIFNEATTNLGPAELGALALHLQHFNRSRATEAALQTVLTVGQRVRIIGGDPRFIGKVGDLQKVSRIRCLVGLEGQSKPAYLFTSDVEPVAAKAEPEAQEPAPEAPASEAPAEV